MGVFSKPCLLSFLVHNCYYGHEPSLSSGSNVSFDSTMYRIHIMLIYAFVFVVSSWAS